MQLKDVKSADSLKVKKVHASFLGLPGNREVWGIHAGNKPIYRTKRGGGQGTAYYKLSADGAKVMLKELKAKVEEEKATAKTPRATKTTQRSAAPKPRATSAASSAALTISGCSKFLRDKGYSVSKPKTAKRKDAEVDDLADYYTSLAAENNPRRRLSRRRLNNPGKRTRKKSVRDNAQFLRELKKAAKAQDLRIELYGADGIEFIDTLTEASTGTIRLEQPAGRPQSLGGESDFSLFLDVSFGPYGGAQTAGHLGLLTADAVGRRAARTQQMSMAELAKAVAGVAGFLSAGYALENIPDEMGTPQFQVLSYADRYEVDVPLVVEGFESNPRRRRRKNRSNVPSADRGGTYVMFWDDPNGPDPIVFTSSKGEDATYKAIQSDALYDYEYRAYGEIKPMRADAALLLLEQQMLREDSDGYFAGSDERYQYNRVLAAVNAYKRRVTPAQAKKKVQTALRDFVHPFEEGPVYGNPRALRRKNPRALRRLR